MTLVQKIYSQVWYPIDIERQCVSSKSVVPNRNSTAVAGEAGVKAVCLSMALCRQGSAGDN